MYFVGLAMNIGNIDYEGKHLLQLLFIFMFGLIADKKPLQHLFTHYVHWKIHYMIISMELRNMLSKFTMIIIIISHCHIIIINILSAIILPSIGMYALRRLFCRPWY